MFKMQKKHSDTNGVSGIKKEPAFLREDYPYKAIGEAINNPAEIQPNLVYEIKCPKCEMSIRSQGASIVSTYNRIISGTGCIGCGNNELIIRQIDMSI